MRVGVLIAGLLVALMGIAWALQGLWILPATFMRGPEWVAIGGGVALVGVLLIWFAMRGPKPAPAPPAQG